MKTYRYAKCGATVTVAIEHLGFVRVQCGKLPAEHGTERRRIDSAVTVAHPFVLTNA